MKDVVIENPEKTFRSNGERVKALDDLSFEVESGQLFTLFGPSGCGKTTTLRCLAGARGYRWRTDFHRG